MFKTIVNLAQQVSRDSAMSPYSHLCTVICLPAFLGLGFSIYEKNTVGQFIFGFFAILPICLFAKAYSHFMRHNPDCLRSEKYLLQRQVIDKIGDQNGEAQIEGIATIKDPPVGYIEGDQRI